MRYVLVCGLLMMTFGLGAIYASHNYQTNQVHGWVCTRPGR